MSTIFDQITEMVEEGLYSVINNPEIVLLNLVALIVLFIVVKKFFWEKVTLYLEKRQALYMQTLDEAHAEKELAQSLQEKAMKEYETMKEETRELRDRLTSEAHAERDLLIQNAKAEVKRRLEQAEKDIDYEVSKANEDIKNAIKEIAFSAASKIVKREIDEALHQDIIEEILNDGKNAS